MKRILFSLFLLALAALPAGATDFASHHLLVPIAARTAGALGTQWKTDLVVTNAATKGEPQTVEIYFIADGHLAQPVLALLQPRQTVVMTDIIRGSFGKDEARGLFLIAVRDPKAKLTARARVYNTGSAAGQYGQTVQAMPLDKLSEEAYLPGLSGIHGNRTNVGISNPHATPTDFWISLYDRDGEFRGGFSTRVAPYSVMQLNDVFGHFQAGPLDGATIEIKSSNGVYSYASIVRADSGDADFVIGTGTDIDDSEAVVAPQCANPATLSLAALPADGWTVLYKPGVNQWTVTPSLEARHGFKAEQIYHFGGFHTRYMTPAMVAALRCENTVRVVEQNGYVPVF